MAYTYNKVNWEDLPSTNTPRNANNLGNMDTGIKENNNMLTGASYMGNVIVESIRSKNMFNKMNVIIGAYVAGWSGNLEYNANCVTGYIECEPNTTYTLSKIADYTFGYATCDHIPTIGDSLSQILIEGSGVTHATITTNSTAKYILFWFYWGEQDTNSYEDNLNSAQCEPGSVATAYSPFQQLKFDDTGWIDISQYLNTTHFAIRQGYTPMIRKINNIVYLKGAVYCHTSPNNIFATLFSNLPSEFIASYESLGGGVHWELGTPYAINMGSGSINVTESSNISPTYEYQGYTLTNIPPYIV